MIVDIVYLTWNRLAFVEASLECLIRNTDWDLVSKLFVYDDHSDDGTYDYVAERLRGTEIPWEMTTALERHSPVAVMNHYANDCVSDVFCKIDNDIVVPEGWLGEMLGVLDRNLDLELLGMEAGLPDRHWDEWDGPRSWTPSSHIGGVGAIRTTALTTRLSIPANGRFGWTEWQSKYRPVRGWVTPDLPVCQLDRIPTEPWQTLSAEYIEKGWQRHWSPHDPEGPPFWEWFTEKEES